MTNISHKNQLHLRSLSYSIFSHLFTIKLPLNSQHRDSLITCNPHRRHRRLASPAPELFASLPNILKCSRRRRKINLRRPLWWGKKKFFEFFTIANFSFSRFYLKFNIKNKAGCHWRRLFDEVCMRKGARCWAWKYFHFFFYAAA